MKNPSLIQSEIEDLGRAFSLFEKRLGGVSLSDLENGDEEAMEIATQSLREEFNQLISKELCES
ncbi:hypothetical protein A8L34_28195 [Bacillus sp. FJAT-27264]|uniref:hypothetical protein n=1 Tax=Paenibacillus sp. (strain DSM 101736 / FJAT-27264) TaxID=1850362 RepID=UPI000807BF9C|nr:hypothetical protein [Bacillus sp. FJAT-27264]OBZ15930.1 hypothetical protein A8L34_28195 [Bacillus sp. FJAT-27264]